MRLSLTPSWLPLGTRFVDKKLWCVETNDLPDPHRRRPGRRFVSGPSHGARKAVAGPCVRVYEALDFETASQRRSKRFKSLFPTSREVLVGKTIRRTAMQWQRKRAARTEALFHGEESPECYVAVRLPRTPSPLDGPAYQSQRSTRNFFGGECVPEPDCGCRSDAVSL